MKLKILSIISFAVVMMLCISHIEANAYLSATGDNTSTAQQNVVGGQL